MSAHGTPGELAMPSPVWCNFETSQSFSGYADDNDCEEPWNWAVGTTVGPQSYARPLAFLSVKRLERCTRQLKQKLGWKLAAACPATMLLTVARRNTPARPTDPYYLTDDAVLRRALSSSWPMKRLR